MKKLLIAHRIKPFLTLKACVPPMASSASKPCADESREFHEGCMTRNEPGKHEKEHSLLAWAFGFDRPACADLRIPLPVAADPHRWPGGLRFL
jgi:hypothetical protein